VCGCSVCVCGAGVVCGVFVCLCVCVVWCVCVLCVFLIYLLHAPLQSVILHA